MYQVPDQSGRRIIVTGANSGTGLEATRRLAAAGAEVVMAVRNLAKGEAARDDLLAENPSAKLELRQLDLADLASVRAFANKTDRVDVLVNNAGVMAPRQRFLTVDGFELQLGSDYLGPFLLTKLLLPTLLKAEAPRVVTMASIIADMGRIHLDDLNGERRPYIPFREYGQAKLADLLVATRLADMARENGWPLTSIAAHPGYTRTNLQTAGANLGQQKQREPSQWKPFYTQGVEQGAEPLLFAAADPAAVSGAYYGPRYYVRGPVHRARIPLSARRSDPKALWDLASSLVE